MHSQWGTPETKNGILIYLPCTKVASVFNNQKICLTDLSIISFSAGSISSSTSPSSNSTLFAKASSSTSSNFDVSPGWGRNLLTSALWHAKLRPFESYNMEKKKKSVTRQLWQMCFKFQWSSRGKKKIQWHDGSDLTAFYGFVYRNTFLLIFSSPVLLFILWSFNPLRICETEFPYL